MFEKMRNLFRKKRPIIRNKTGLSRQRNAIFSSVFGGSHMVSGEKYEDGVSGSGTSLVFDHKGMRANVRRMMYDSPICKAIVDRFVSTVIDKGLVLESTIDADVIGITEAEAQKWTRDVEKKFNLWANSKSCHRSGTMNFYQAQKFYAFSMFRDNDVFVRMYYNDDPQLLNPLQFSFIDPNQIGEDGFTDTSGTESFEDGIKRDSKGIEVSYNVLVQTKPYTYKNVNISKQKHGRTYMLHGFIENYAGQTRGYPFLAHAIQDFNNLEDFSLAQVKKAITQSNIAIFTKPQAGEDASNPMAQMSISGAGVVSQEETAPIPNAEIEEGVTYTGIPQADFSRPGAMGVFDSKNGDELKPFANTSPSENYGSFVDAKVDYLSASVGMPIEMLKMKFNNNYSASRATLLMYWKVVEKHRQDIASDFLDSIYEMWLSEEIASGRVKVFGWNNPRIKQAWLSSRWIGSSLPNIDPLKQAKAIKENIELGLSTLERESRNHNGTDGATNRRKLSEELKELTTPPWNKNAEAKEEEKGENDGKSSKD